MDGNISGYCLPIRLHTLYTDSIGRDVDMFLPVVCISQNAIHHDVATKLSHLSPFRHAGGQALESVEGGEEGVKR